MRVHLIYHLSLDCGKLGVFDAKVFYDWFPIDQEVRIKQISIPALYLNDVTTHLSKSTLKDIVREIQEVNIGG